jgi:hypothetical protein
LARFYPAILVLTPEIVVFLENPNSGVKKIFLNQNRDLKPENIIFETKDPNSKIKVIDFGTSCAFEKGNKLKKKLGTVTLPIKKLNSPLAILHCP